MSEYYLGAIWTPQLPPVNFAQVPQKTSDPSRTEDPSIQQRAFAGAPLPAAKPVSASGVDLFLAKESGDRWVLYMGKDNKPVMSFENEEKAIAVKEKIEKALEDAKGKGKPVISVEYDKNSKDMIMKINGVAVRNDTASKADPFIFLKWADNLAEASGGTAADIKRVDYSEESKKWTIRVGGDIVMRFDPSKNAEIRAQRVATKLQLALLCLPEKKEDNRIKVELYSQYSANLFINGIQIRTEGFEKIESMAVWANNLRGIIGGKLDSRGVAQGRLLQKAAKHFGRAYSYGVWDCSAFVHALIPKLKDGSIAMCSTAQNAQLQKIASPAQAKPGDIILVVVIMKQGQTMKSDPSRRPGQPWHVAVAMCLGDGKFLFMENSSRGNTHSAIRTNFKYDSIKAFVLDKRFIPDPDYSA